MTPLGLRLYSLSQLAEIFDIYRATVRKRLSGVKPDGMLRKNPAYTIKTAAEHLVERYKQNDVELDPDKMSPDEARSYWDSKLKEQKFLENDGDLWRSEEVLDALSGVAKNIALPLRGIPDILERRAGLEPHQVELVTEIVNATMKEMHDRLIEDYGADAHTDVS